MLELAGLGPAPFGCMVLSDLGADVLRVGRPDGVSGRQAFDTLNRGRRNIVIDLKSEDGLASVRRLGAAADVMVEGFRPGVAERLGVGPNPMCAANPRLVYARMTGWGQDGPLAQRAGHDINYASIAGVIGAIGEPGRKPVPPLNLVADFGGGGMFLVAGVLAALIERNSSGLGQVVDVAMVDGTAMLMAMALGFTSVGLQTPKRGTNLLDGGAPFYDCYECSDGGWISVGALEPQFFAEFVRVLGIAEHVPPQNDRNTWPQMRDMFAAVIKSRPRSHWTEVFDGVDACVTPVLAVDEVVRNPHIAERGTVQEVNGVLQPAAAPRFSRTPADSPTTPRDQHLSTGEALSAWDC